MRKPLIVALTCVILLLQVAAVAQARSDDDLKSLQLFGPEAQPRFELDLACTAESSASDVQCATVRTAFGQWASARNIALHPGSKDDPEFDGKAVPANGTAATPFHMAILFEPVLVTPMHNWSGTFNMMANSYTPGSTGYRATVFVYDAATGALMRKLSLHQRHEMPDNANVTPLMKAEIQDMIAHIDPDYSP